ncbi:MAG: carboxypeptidase-like regulatory domain-containing protein [Planctomycetota bacterium]|nr:carboxypeptidase-like regulatory domain-containing protein [Planctomycetota bacterium]
MSSPGTPTDDLGRPPEVEGSAISGHVRDFQGVPMVGVRVEAAESGGGDLDLLPVLTDGDGAFSVEGLVPSARYDLRFALGTVRSRALAVPTGTDQLEVKLARPQGILLVAKVEAGQPPPPVFYVVLHRATPKGVVREYYGRTLRSRLLLWSIRPGRYTVTVWGGSYLPVQATGIDVLENTPAPEVEVLLGPLGGTIGGEISDASGHACPAIVSWRRIDAPGHVPLHMTTVPTTPHGDFVLRGLPAGRYRVSAFSEQKGVGDVEVEVHEQESTSVDVILA